MFKGTLIPTPSGRVNTATAQGQKCSLSQFPDRRFLPRNIMKDMELVPLATCWKMQGYLFKWESMELLLCSFTDESTEIA